MPDLLPEGLAAPAPMTSWVYWVGPLYALVSVVVAAIAIRCSAPGSTARAFAWWLAVVATANCLQVFLAFALHQTTLWIGHAYHPVAALLLARAGWLSFSTDRLRRGSLIVGVAVSALCVGLIVAGIQSLNTPSRYGSPAFYFAATAFGVLLIAQSITDRAVAPFDNALLWMGLGIVILCGPSVVAGPVFAAARLLEGEPAAAFQQSTQWVKLPATALLAVPYLRRGIRWPR